MAGWRFAFRFLCRVSKLNKRCARDGGAMTAGGRIGAAIRPFNATGRDYHRTLSRACAGQARARA